MATTRADLADHLRRTVPGLAVDDGDGLTAEALVVDGLTARAMATPTREEEVAALLALASAEGWRVHVRGGGSQEEAAEPIVGVDVVLSLAALRGITEHAPEDLTLGAWAGTPLPALTDRLGRVGQRLPNPPLAQTPTLGGIVATGQSGPFRLGHRTPRDSVLGLRLCLADGSVVRTGSRVVKNVAGYDLTRLVIGSLGTLAVVTAAFVRVAPQPPATATLWCEGDDRERSRERLVDWQGAGLEPVAFEHLDGGAALAAGLGDGQGTLCAFEDETEAVDAVVAIALSDSGATGAVLTDPAAHLAWQTLHHAPAASALLLRLSTLPADVPALLEVARATRHKAGLPPLALRAGVGTGMSHLWGPAGELAAEARFVAGLRSEAEARGGRLVLERAPLALRRTVGVFGTPPAAAETMRALKRALDPAGILGPGRMAFEREAMA